MATFPEYQRLQNLISRLQQAERDALRNDADVRTSTESATALWDRVLADDDAKLTAPAVNDISARWAWLVDGEVIAPTYSCALLRRALHVVHPRALLRLFMTEGRHGVGGRASEAEARAREARESIEKWQRAQETLADVPRLHSFGLRESTEEKVRVLEGICSFHRGMAAWKIAAADELHTRSAARSTAGKKRRTANRRKVLAAVYPALLAGGLTRIEIAELWISSAKWQSPPCPEFSMHYSSKDRGADALAKLIDEDIADARAQVRKSNRPRRSGKSATSRAA